MLSLPHLEAGDQDCPGSMMPRNREDGRVDLICNECGKRFGTVQRGGAQPQLDEIARTAASRNDGDDQAT